MKLCVKQQIFSFFCDRFYVTDENGEQVYYIESEALTFLKKFHIYTMSGEEAGYIEQRFNLFFPRLDIYTFGTHTATIQKLLTLFHQEYSVEGPGWYVAGDFLSHEYEITCSGESIAHISKEWLTFGDCYTVETKNPEDMLLALAIMLIIDLVLASSNNH